MCIKALRSDRLMLLLSLIANIIAIFAYCNHNYNCLNQLVKALPEVTVIVIDSLIVIGSGYYNHN